MSGVVCSKRGKYWQYHFEVGTEGKRKRLYKGGFRTKAEAFAAGTKAHAEFCDSGVVFKPSEKTYSEFLKMWIESFGTTNWKKGTLESRQKALRLYVLPELGNYKLSALTSLLLQSFIDKKAREGFSRNSLSNLKGILSGSLNYAVQKGLLKYNPMYSVKLPSPRNDSIVSRSAPNVVVPADKLEAIFKMFPEDSSSYIPLMLGYHCGLRLGETFAITWDCVDLENKTLTVNKQVQWDARTGSWYFTAPKYESNRTMEIDDELWEALKTARCKQLKAREYYGEHYTLLYEDEYRNINKERGTEIELVNVREDGTYVSPRSMTHAAYRIHHQMGYEDFTFHSLRHTHATMLVENGAPLKYVQKRLGHGDVVVTMRVYQHLTKKISESGTVVLNDIFAKK